MRPRLTLLLVLLAATIAGASLAAQQPQRGPDNWSRTIVPGIDVLPLPGMPFSGMGKTVWTRPVEGGGAVTSYLQANAIRDGQGRIYRERHHFSSSETIDPQATLYEFSVRDLVNRTDTVCEVATHQCRIANYRPAVAAPLQPVGAFDQGRRVLTRDSLGNQYLQGLPVVGTLEKIAISPGTIGNDQLITLSREFWYSADLETNLSVIRKDPRQGTQTITMTILSRGEPDASMFAVPPGYTVIDDRRAARPSN
jgi:hypothetical protein